MLSDEEKAEIAGLVWRLVNAKPYDEPYPYLPKALGFILKALYKKELEDYESDLRKEISSSR